MQHLPRQLTQAACLRALRNSMQEPKDIRFFDSIKKWCNHVLYQPMDELMTNMALTEGLFNEFEVTIDSLAEQPQRKALMALYLNYLRVVNPIKHKRILEFLDNPSLDLPLSRKLYQIIQEAQPLYGMPDQDKREIPVELPKASILPHRLSIFNGPNESIINQNIKKWYFFMNLLQTKASLSPSFCAQLESSPAESTKQTIQLLLHGMSEEIKLELFNKIDLELIKKTYGPSSNAFIASKRLKNALSQAKEQKNRYLKRKRP